MSLSPMMEQYKTIKSNHEDCILFFRLGDFYEMFFDDALIASRELEITLTGKNCGQEERAPMCGVPFHSAENYIGKLMEKGYKVAICEQVEDPKASKGIVKREVVKIITPGTVMSHSMLKENESNYIVSLYLDQNNMSITYCDISTGELFSTEVTEESLALQNVIDEIVKLKAKEIIVNENIVDFCNIEKICTDLNIYVSYIPTENFNEKNNKETICAHFDLMSLESLGLEDKKYSIFTLGNLISYLKRTQMTGLKQLTTCRYYNLNNTMALDRATIRNLEITETIDGKGTKGSLLSILDRTNTAMGRRKIKKWLREPLNHKEEIALRLNAVEELTEEILVLNNVKTHLKKVYDFERLIGRVASGNANGRDIIALKESAGVIPYIKENLNFLNSELIMNTNNQIDTLSEVYNLIDDAINNEPPITVKDGGLIKEGYSNELDELKDSIKDGKLWIANLENIERERTGIKNLKVGYNKVFGYYLEITKSYYDMIPEDYIRKQTLSNCERFITPKLKEMESLVLNAETKINLLEYNLFINIRDEIEKYIKTIQETSQGISTIDVLCSFAETSNMNNYTKPVISDAQELIITNGRHPVVEQITGRGMFVPNDASINNSDCSMLLITGPNMAGKSTYMRQTALIVLMAQAGCFVPCEGIIMGVFDRIFTRIGASDNLSQGQSTFYVEMSELAYILNCATSKSLIILDEIGRGTSTYDGMSIAWATVNYLCNNSRKIATMFATHYHELTSLENEIDGVKNLNVKVAEDNGNIVFLHKIVDGIASKSYGIHVAQIAGVPDQLLNEATIKLGELENTVTEYNYSNMEVPLANNEPIEGSNNTKEHRNLDLINMIKDIDLMNTTPHMAIKILEELKGQVNYD